MLTHFFWAKSSVVSNFSSSLENTTILHGNNATEKVKAQTVSFGHLLWMPPPYQLCYPEKKVTHRDSYCTLHLDCVLICGTNPDSLQEVTFPRLSWCSCSTYSPAFIQNCVLLYLLQDYKANKISISTMPQTRVLLDIGSGVWIWSEVLSYFSDPIFYIFSNRHTLQEILLAN